MLPIMNKGCTFTCSPTHLLGSPAAYHAVFVGLVADTLATIQSTDALEILRG